MELPEKLGNDAKRGFRKLKACLRNPRCFIISDNGKNPAFSYWNFKSMLLYLQKPKTMKNFLFLMLFISINFTHSFGQERVNREKLRFIQSSERLTQATGWSYNSTLGEWIDYNNVISDDKSYKDRYKSLQGSIMKSSVDQNFNWMQMRTVVFNGETYYILVIEKWDGSYKYPNIRRDWKAYKVKEGYIFSVDEYRKLENITGLIGLTATCIVRFNERYKSYNETEFLDRIQTELSKTKISAYIFTIMKSTEGAIRFYVPSYHRRSASDFKKEYFETDYNNFSKLLIK